MSHRLPARRTFHSVETEPQESPSDTHFVRRCDSVAAPALQFLLRSPEPSGAHPRAILGAQLRPVG
jgi:hypothetical protein